MSRPPRQPDSAAEPDLRVVGGKWRGTRIAYHGDPLTRPMKHRVREAIFNLVGPAVKGTHAVDLFAGTGALGIEAMSRGASGATFIERHIPTAAVVRQNLAAVGAEGQTRLLTTSAFLWAKRDLAGAGPKPASRRPPADTPWLVFVCPPYAFFAERLDEMLELIATVREHAPPESILIVEADERLDFAVLPGGVRESRHEAGWDVREYAPAVVGVWRPEVEI